jgi:hypothetical protein
LKIEILSAEDRKDNAVLVEDNAVFVGDNAVLVRRENSFAGRRIKKLLNFRCGDKRMLVK